MPNPAPVETPQEYLIELVRGRSPAPERAMLLPNVFSFERQPIPADDKSYSIKLGPRPLTQSAGLVSEEWTFQGRSGEEEREVTFIDQRQSFTRMIAGGVAIFEELLRFLRDYEADKALYKSTYSRNPDKAPSLIVRALKEGLAFYCDEVRIVPLRQVGSSRFTYDYTLTLTTEGEAKAEPYDKLVNNPVKALPIVDAAAAKALNKAAMTAPSLLAGATAETGFVESGVDAAAPAGSIARALERVPGDLAQFRQPVETFARQVAESVELVERATRAGIGFPRDVAANLAHYAVRASSSIYRLWDELEIPLRDRARAVKDELQRAVRAVARSMVRVLGTAGAKLGDPATEQTTTIASNVQAVSGRAVRVLRLFLGEDLASFAFRVLGDSERWFELAALNGMTSAWSLGDGRPLLPGTPILVPVDEGPTTRPDADPSDLYRTDLRWDFRRHDIVVEGDSPTDFATIAGAKNLRQAMLRRATVPLGRCRVMPRLGIPHGIGRNTSAERAALLASQVVSQFAGDPRIKAIRDVKIVQLANTFNARLVAEGISGETLPLSGISTPVE